MKKKTVSLILILALAASLVACGNSAGGESGNSTDEEKSQTDSDEIIVTADDMQSYLEEVDVTSDNWEEYFSVEDTSYVAGDDGMDAMPGETVNAKLLKTKENIIASDDLQMHFTYTQTCTDAFYYNCETGEAYTGDANTEFYVGKAEEEDSTIAGVRLQREGTAILCSDKDVGLSLSTMADGNDYWLEKQVDIQDLKLTSCSGSVYQVNIPEDKWNEDPDHGRYLVLEDDYTNLYLFESGAYGYGSVEAVDWESEDTGDNGSASWPWYLFLETSNAETESTESGETKDPDSVTYQAYAAEDIQSDLYSDITAAMEKYEGQYVEITGILDCAEVNENSTPAGKVVSLETTVEAPNPNHPLQINAYAWDDEWLSLEDFEAAIADMQEGDTVILRGYIAPGDITEEYGLSMDLIDVNKK